MRYHFDPRDKSPRAMFYRAHDRSADLNAAFMDMMRGPNPLTPEEIDRLIELRPERYARFAGFGAKALAAKANKES